MDHVATHLFCHLLRGDRGATHARIDLTQIRAHRLLRYRALTRACVDVDDQFWGIEFYDRTVEFGVVVGADLANEDWARLPTEPAPQTGHTLPPAFAPADAEMLELSTLVVTADGVFWTARVAHTDLDLETPILAWDTIEAYSTGELAAPVAPHDPLEGDGGGADDNLIDPFEDPDTQDD